MYVSVIGERWRTVSARVKLDGRLLLFTITYSPYLTITLQKTKPQYIIILLLDKFRTSPLYEPQPLAPNPTRRVLTIATVPQMTEPKSMDYGYDTQRTIIILSA